MFAKSCVLLLFVASSFVASFPDGAPADTCVKGNRPKHGQTKSQDLQTLPYQIVASSDQFGPGAEIQIVISGRDVFRGFFLQARDENNKWVGEWQQTENTKTIPECSAITHGDNKDKVQAVLIWKAPNDRKGYVYFTGTVLKDFGNYWAEAIAQVAV